MNFSMKAASELHNNSNCGIPADNNSQLHAIVLGGFFFKFYYFSQPVLRNLPVLSSPSSEERRADVFFSKFAESPSHLARTA